MGGALRRLENMAAAKNAPAAGGKRQSENVGGGGGGARRRHGGINSSKKKRQRKWDLALARQDGRHGGVRSRYLLVLCFFAPRSTRARINAIFAHLSRSDRNGCARIAQRIESMANKRGTSDADSMDGGSGLGRGAIGQGMAWRAMG